MGLERLTPTAAVYDHAVLVGSDPLSLGADGLWHSNNTGELHAIAEALLVVVVQ